MWGLERSGPKGLKSQVEDLRRWESISLPADRKQQPAATSFHQLTERMENATKTDTFLFIFCFCMFYLFTWSMLFPRLLVFYSIHVLFFKFVWNPGSVGTTGWVAIGVPNKQITNKLTWAWRLKDRRRQHFHHHEVLLVVVRRRNVCWLMSIHRYNMRKYWKK